MKKKNMDISDLRIEAEIECLIAIIKTAKRIPESIVSGAAAVDAEIVRNLSETICNLEK